MPQRSSSLDLSRTSHSDEDEFTNGSYERGSRPKTSAIVKAFTGLTAMSVLCFLIFQDSLQQQQQAVAKSHTWAEITGDESSYGVDVSWPIHHSIHHDQHVFGEGVRHQAYMKHLQGCRKHYSHLKSSDIDSCDNYEFQRLLMNRRQPQSMENYTDVGFAKVQAPPEVAKLVKDFWEANKAKQIPEDWPEGNIYINHWEAPSMMVSVDDTRLRGNGYGFKKQVWDAARSTISEWTGGQDITEVSMYGIRVYTNNSVLVPHVDRLPLVASAMINVAQDVDEPWPMEIYDHDGQAHNVTLEPGDMLLFESHSVMHGRPFPMKGRFYAMLFIHFEPTGKTPLKQRLSVDEQYRQAVEDGVGGQSSSDENKLLPPYIQRFSPEEQHWLRENPDGWWGQAPVPAPATMSDGEDSDENTKQQPQQPEGNQAARVGDLKYWIDALNEAAADEDARYQLINRRDTHGWQPIHESAANGNQEIVDVLLKYGADINARTNGGKGGTPLFWAEKKLGSEHAIVRYLVDRGALYIPPDLFREEL